MLSNTVRVHFFGKIQDWIFELDYTRICFCERNEKSRKGFCRVTFLTPHAPRVSLRAKSKMAESLFSKCRLNDFQIYDELAYRLPEEEVIPILKAHAQTDLNISKLATFSRSQFQAIQSKVFPNVKTYNNGA